MKTQKLDIQTADGACDCFVAYPEKGGPFPAILLYMDAYGPREYLYEMAQKMASHGLYVLMPNLLYRARRAPLLDVTYPLTAETGAQVRPQLMALIGGFKPEESLHDGEYFLSFLSKQKEVKPGPIAITGYCMGGSMALRMAARYPDRIAAAASYHAGRLATDASDSPHLLASKLKAQIYIAHADNDLSMPADQILKLEQTFDVAGVKYQDELYKGAGHGFTMMDLPPGNAEALERHWQSLFNLVDSVFSPN